MFNNFCKLIQRSAIWKLQLKLQKKYNRLFKQLLECFYSFKQRTNKKLEIKEKAQIKTIVENSLVMRVIKKVKNIAVNPIDSF